jgi:DNA invertase Pin-like site-specific DNA recombinase
MTDHKIQRSHRQRAAYVYVRQSTIHQVHHNRESRERQYRLVERAKQLGFVEVAIIDEDQGRSGSGSDERPGFGRLLIAVCEGKVGAVLALEASRLARNNRDWHHLVDLCALTDTLVIDDDGVYDPRHVNDRLILGMKGNMAEFELGLLRQRAQEALRQMIARGLTLWEVPIGYLRTENNDIVMTPDRQIQQAIRSVFSRFRVLGSARQVLLWFVQEKIPLPCLRIGSQGRDVTWKLPTYKRIHAILTNPIYAGAFCHGRTGTRVHVVEGRARKTRGHRLPLEQWRILLRDHHPGYISWQEFETIQQQLASNAAPRGNEQTGAAKSGPALLAGLLRCRRCGRKLHVGYSGKGGRVPRYYCRDGQINRGTEWCISFGGLRVDQAVSAAVLEAVQPARIDAALLAYEAGQRQGDEKRQALELALEKARYEADRLRRQYDAVEPENRLVAAQLECNWEQALHTVNDLQDRLTSYLATHPDVEEGTRTRLQTLAKDLKSAWEHPAASLTLKKRILRTLLIEIVVDISEDRSEITLWLHWAGGVHTQLGVPKNGSGKHRHCTDRKVIDLIAELAKVCTDRAIASILNKLGLRTGTGKSWIMARVTSLRVRNGIPARSQDKERTWLTLEEAATALQVAPCSVRRWIERGILPAHQVVTHAPWMIERAHLQLPEVQAEVQATRHRRRQQTKTRPSEGVV